MSSSTYTPKLKNKRRKYTLKTLGNGPNILELIFFLYQYHTFDMK